MRFFISRLYFPLAIASSLAVFFTVRAKGGNLELAVVIPSLVAMLVGLALERRWPAHAAWNRPRHDIRTDLTSMAVLFAVVDPLLKWGGPVALVWLYSSAIPSARIFPTTWPFLSQVVLATLIAEFGSYWSHRLHHADRRLWWLHALHHGSKRLYTLNNFRVHPLNYTINFVLGIFPLMVLGASADVIFAYLAVSYPVLMLQHTNLDFRSGWLNYVFSTNELHRWHHSTLPGEGDSNFGRAFILWDIVFKTFRYRPGTNMPAAIGLYASSTYPAQRSFAGQLLSMFRPDCCPSSSAA